MLSEVSAPVHNFKEQAPSKSEFPLHFPSLPIKLSQVTEVPLYAEQSGRILIHPLPVVTHPFLYASQS